MIKWIGAMLIIGACGFCGFSMAGSYGNLERSMRQLYSAMEIMHCQMEYRLTPLPELCQILSAACTGSISKVFQDLGREMEREDACEAAVCMADALAKNPQLPRPCMKRLRHIGSTLGKTDLQTQLRDIAMEMEQIRMELEQIARERPGRVKSYRALGLCCGAALAILLL